MHIQVCGFYPPCVYALLNNKNEATYQRFIAAIKMLTGDCEPARILIDFEKAALNAFIRIHPSSKTSGCYFHLCQSFNRKNDELGLKTVYENYQDFALSVKMIPAFAFTSPAWARGTVLQLGNRRTWQVIGPAQLRRHSSKTNWWLDRVFPENIHKRGKIRSDGEEADVFCRDLESKLGVIRRFGQNHKCS